jgi:uncharacterized damage-inducible protein DinB
MDDEQRRIREYLQAQGAKQSPSAVVGRVRAAMDDLCAAAAAVPAARFQDRPAPEQWSANEVMAHVLWSGAAFGGAILRVLDGQPAGAMLRDVLPPEVERRTARQWAEALGRERESLFRRVCEVDPGAHLDEPIDHGFFGTLNWRETLLFLRLHDLDHAGQLKAIAAALA